MVLVKAQSAMEYMATYGWAILIIAVITSILYLYSTTPTTIVPTSCVFISGVYCNAMVVGSNPSTHATTVALFLTNSQPYPISKPYLFARLNGANTTQTKCSPNYVVQAGSMVCILDLPTKTTLGQFLSGKLYLNATYCALYPNYSRSNLCSGAPRETYAGAFQSHVEPLINTNTTITLTAQNSTQLSNNAKDPLIATVKLLGYPLRGATVNFTANVSGYTISPNYTTTNSTGKALSYIWGSRSGNVIVTASYAGLNASTTIRFIPAFNVRFNVNFPYCSSAGQIITIDGVPYTCPQLSSKSFAWGSNTVHSCVIDNPVTVNSSVRGLCSIISNTGSACTASSNSTININCTTQYFLTMSASPSNAGTVSPSSSWHNQSSVVGINQVTNSGFTFNGWTGSGTVSYTGASSSALVTMNSPVSETSSYVTNVVFTESGLPGGTSWSVTLNGNTLSSTGSSITFSNVVPGSYSWSTPTSISCGTGCQYAVSPSSGTVSTASGSASKAVSYSKQYYLTMSSGGNGAVSPSSGWNAAGIQVGITSSPSAGYYLASWTGTGSGSYTGTAASATVTMNGAISETAAFDNGYYLTMVAGGGGTVSPASGRYPAGSVVAISANPSSGYSFVSWTGTGSGSYTGTNRQFTVTMGSNITETASFRQVPQSYYWSYSSTQSTGGYYGHSAGSDCANYFYSQPNCQGAVLYATDSVYCWDPSVCSGSTGPASCPYSGQCYQGSIGSCNPFGYYWLSGCPYPDYCQWYGPGSSGGSCIATICYPTSGCINT